MLQRECLAVDRELELRPWSIDDAEGFAKCVRDGPEIARWTGFPYEISDAEAVEMVAARDRGWDEGTSAAFALVDTRTAEPLGSAGLLWIDWERRTAEVGYWLTPGARGRGIAARAVKRISEWSFRALDLRRLQLTVDVRNPSSWAVAERAGFVREERLKGVASPAA